MKWHFTKNGKQWRFRHQLLQDAFEVGIIQYIIIMINELVII
jgi:hypothetical protein